MDLAAGLLIALGVLGIVVPFFPGTGLIAATVVVWAVLVAEPVGWACAAAALAVLVVGTVVKYAVPGRRLRSSGVPVRTLLAGAVLGAVGFFVIPVAGLFLGFVAGVYLSELQRVGRDAAWPATKAAVRAVGLSLLIEGVAALLAGGIWLGGALAT